ncbi:UNVERIFIED_CONTAM: hypothetical protein FKN15_010053 [Acipenser sinensis]
MATLLKQKQEQPIAPTKDGEKTLAKCLPTPPGAKSETEELKRVILQLQKQVSSLAVKPEVPVRKEPRQRTPESVRKSFSPEKKYSTDRDTFFCYRCGEDGHIATHCEAPEDLNRVNQKLLRSMRKRRGDCGGFRTPPPTNAEAKVAVKKATSQLDNLPDMPRGLIGPTSANEASSVKLISREPIEIVPARVGGSLREKF